MLQGDGLGSKMPETRGEALSLGQQPGPLFPHPENGDMGACLPNLWEGLRVWCTPCRSALRGGRLGLAVSSGRRHQTGAMGEAQKGRKGSLCGDRHRAGSKDHAELAPGLQRSGAGHRETGVPTGQAPQPVGRGQVPCWGQESAWERFCPLPAPCLGWGGGRAASSPVPCGGLMTLAAPTA